jgi:uncharacterized caspase-like protein
VNRHENDALALGLAASCLGPHRIACANRVSCRERARSVAYLRGEVDVVSKRHTSKAIAVEDGRIASSGRRVVVTIGIDHYHHWQPLTNAVRDATGASELFRRLGFEEFTEPLIDERATGAAIQSLVTDDLQKLHPDDSLVLFYAGHGSTRKSHLRDQVVKVGYLIPVDASDSPGRVATWIDLDAWLRAVSLLPAKHILVIVDACHSGIALEPILKWRDINLWKNTPWSKLVTRQSRRIITSALDDQIALDSGPVHGHSLFTGCLIEALTDGIKKNGRRVTTGSELGLYVQGRVQTYPGSTQTPDFGTFAFDDRGEMIIPLAIDSPQGDLIDSEANARSGDRPDPSASLEIGSYGTPGLRFPLRRTMLVAGAALGASTLGAVGWLWRRAFASEPSWDNERRLLADAIMYLGSRLGMQQEPGGGFKGYYLASAADGYNTGQELSCLMAAVQARPEVFDSERQARALQALGEFSQQEWPKCQDDRYRSATVGVCWAIIAAARYILLQNNAEAVKLVIWLRDILLKRQLDDGSFEYGCNIANHGYASAYATGMALWACCELERANASTPALTIARRAAAVWLAKQYVSLPTSDYTAISSIRGLAEQIFWILERSRYVDNRRPRNQPETQISEMVVRQLLKDCSPDPGRLCLSPDGKIPNGRETTEKYSMLWLPWGTLATLEIMTDLPRSHDLDMHTVVTLMRRLINALAAHGTMSVTATLFEPAEHLFAMAEVFLRLPG